MNGSGRISRRLRCGLSRSNSFTEGSLFIWSKFLHAPPVDHDGCDCGDPVALFLFLAPSGAKATHAGYDTSILTKKKTDSFTPGELEPAVVITDADTEDETPRLTFGQASFLSCVIPICSSAGPISGTTSLAQRISQTSFKKKVPCYIRDLQCTGKGERSDHHPTEVDK